MPTPSCLASSSSTEISGSRAASSGVHHRPAMTLLRPGGGGRPRQDVLARQEPRILAPRAHVRGQRLAVDRREARAHDGDQLGRGAALAGHELREGRRLVGLHVDEEEGGRALGAPRHELLAQAGLEERDGDDQHHGEAERDEHGGRVAARAVEIGRALPPGERAPPAAPGQRDDEPRAEAKRQERAGQPAEEEPADLPRARLPEGEPGEAGRDGDQAEPRPPPAQDRLDVAPQDQRGRHPPDLEQRPEGEEQGDAHAHREAPEDGERRDAAVERDRQEPDEEGRQERLQRAAEDGAEQAAAESQERGLEQVDGEHLPGGRAEALEDGDRAELLPDEGAHAHGDADAAHHERHEPGEAQVHGELIPEAAETGLRLRIGGDADGGVGHRRGELRLEGLGVPSLRQHDQRAMTHAAARPHEAGPVEVLGRDQHARPEREDADGAVGLLRDDPAQRELRLADPHAVADPQAEPRQQ